jgi:hypothetical protein
VRADLRNSEPREVLEHSYGIHELTNPFARLCNPQHATKSGHRVVRADELPDTSGVDVMEFAKIQYDLSLTAAEKPFNIRVQAAVDWRSKRPFYVKN